MLGLKGLAILLRPVYRRDLAQRRIILLTSHSFCCSDNVLCKFANYGDNKPQYLVARNLKILVVVSAEHAGEASRLDWKRRLGACRRLVIP